MSFRNLQLHPIIARNLGLMGFDAPRPIQSQAIGPIVAGRDLIGLAPTGTGKTAAFVAPMLHHLISTKPPQRKGRPVEPMRRLRALVLCPTRELARQVFQDASAMAQGSVLRIAVAYGKVSMRPQIEMLERGVDLLIATPGRVRELLEAGALSLAHIKHVAVDEADRMLDMGFLPQVTAILQAIPSGFQLLLLSATMPDEVAALADQFLDDPVRIEISGHSEPVTHVEQHLVPVADDDKVELLLHLMMRDDRRGVLVFCRTRRRVGWVATALQRHGIACGALHGDRSQAQRLQALDRFANRELRALVASDVAARGLHIPAVKTVVNYDLPLTPHEYVHRIGRAAHGDPSRHGESFTFLAPDDRMRWRAILDGLNVQVFAEQAPGFGPTRGGRRRAEESGRRQSQAREKSPKSGPARKRDASRVRRSSKSRPIKKGQKPGLGVRTLPPRGQ